MSEAQDESLFEAVVQRLSQLATHPDRLLCLPWQSLCDPPAAAIGLERWLDSTGSASIQIDAALEDEPGLVRLLKVLSASAPMADGLSQNPELASLCFERPIAKDPFEILQFQTEAFQLISKSTSIAHLQDRLRYLKQKYTVEIAARDLNLEQIQPEIWKLLSNLAQELIGIAASSLWQRFSVEHDLPPEIPLAILAMGKLGSHELNYSSDVDLVFVCKDGLDWQLKSKVDRFAAQLVHSMAEPMGRGRLFRVDLRLRPFGGVGEIAPTAAAFQKYIGNYAEPWEIMALTRGECLTIPGQSDWFSQQFEAMRAKYCFENPWSEASIANLALMRQSLDAFADREDFKRGEGGIRDVEFIAQILQILAAGKHPELTKGTTLQLLEELAKCGLIEGEVLKKLSINYIFLRTLEHRCQMLGDQQTHQLPASPFLRKKIACLMGYSSTEALEDYLQGVLLQNRTIYKAQMGKLLPSESEDQTQIPAISARLRKWLVGFPLGANFLAAVSSSQDVLDATEKLVDLAPIIVERASESLSLTESILSGENFGINSAEQALDLFKQVPVDEFQGERFGRGLNDLVWNASANWVLDPSYSLPESLLDIAKAYIQCLAERVGLDEIPGLSLCLLGAFARLEAGPKSDLDTLFLLDANPSHLEAEGKVQSFLRLSEEAVRFGAPFSFDLRLRPEGKKGIVVRTLEGMKQYARSDLELWERFAIGQYHPVLMTEAANYLLYELGYGLPLTPPRLKELLEMKGRIERERVSDGSRWRDIKLGSGGLNDIEWMVHLTEMRYPLATKGGESAAMLKRIENLGSAGLLHVGEVDELKEGYSYLVKMKIWLNLQLGSTSIRPENPDKLKMLASAMGYEDGNDLLEDHTKKALRIRQLFEETIDRLVGKQSH